MCTLYLNTHLQLRPRPRIGEEDVINPFGGHMAECKDVAFEVTRVLGVIGEHIYEIQGRQKEVVGGVRGLGVQISQQDDGGVASALLDEGIYVQTLAVPVPWIQLQWRVMGGKIEEEGHRWENQWTRTTHEL